MPEEPEAVEQDEIEGADEVVLEVEQEDEEKSSTQVADEILLLWEGLQFERLKVLFEGIRQLGEFRYPGPHPDSSLHNTDRGLDGDVERAIDDALIALANEVVRLAPMRVCTGPCTCKGDA